MERLTDKQKKEITAAYAETQSLRETARKTNTPYSTVRRVVQSMPDVLQQAEAAKAKNTADVITHLAKKGGEACSIIDLYLEAMKKPEKIEKANIVQLATSIGILIDKFTDKEGKPADTSLMEALLSAVAGNRNAEKE